MAALRFMLSLLMIPITLFIALSSIMGALAVYVHPETSWTIAILGLLLPATLTMNLCFVYIGQIKKKKWISVPHDTILLNIPISYLYSNFHPLLTPKTIRFASRPYNILNFKNLESNHTSIPDIVNFSESE